MNCILCDVPITEANDSREHLIANAIGGWKRVTGVLCEPCNNKSGHRWDCELAAQLNPLSLIFRIKRDRGDIPSQDFSTTVGEEYRLSRDGSMQSVKPEIEIRDLPDRTTEVRISARSVAEARQILLGLKRKRLPDLDVERQLAAANQHSKYPEGMIKFSLNFGGELAGRSAVKSVVCLAASSGADYRLCTNALSYLRAETGGACFGYYHHRDLLLNRPAGVPLHCLAVSNRSTEGQLLGYVEFFGIQRMVVLLSDSYAGPDVHDVYAIDPVAGVELHVELSLSLPRSEMEAAFRYERTSGTLVESAVGAVLAPALKRSHEQEQSRVVSNAAEYAFRNCGAAEGEQLTDQHIRKLSSLFAEQLAPYVAHILVRPQKPE